MTDETGDIEETRATTLTSNEPSVVPPPTSQSSQHGRGKDAERANSLPHELSQMQCQDMKDNEELPTSSAASVSKDDFSSLTPYSIFSKEQRRRRQLFLQIRNHTDTEVPTNPEPHDVAIPAVVDLPHIQDLQPLPSLVILGNVGCVPTKTLVQQPIFGGLVPDWIRESPGWIKRILLLCLFFLLAALFLILAVASRDGSASSGSNPSRTSIGLGDIPANTPTDSVPTASPTTVGPPVSWPYPAISSQQEYPTHAPVAWQAGMPALLSSSPTLTRKPSETHRTSPPTSLLKTIDLEEETDGTGGDFWELLPLFPTPAPSVSMKKKPKMSSKKGVMSSTKQSMKMGMDGTKKLNKKSWKTSSSMRMARSEEHWQKQGR